MAEKSVSPHFLGAIVLDQMPSSAGGIDLRSVIDGQHDSPPSTLSPRLLDVLLEVARLAEAQEQLIRLIL